MKKILKKFSALFQTSKESFRKHNQEFQEPGKLELERQGLERNKKQGTFNSPSFKFNSLLETYPQVREVAYDIGSGAGWLSGELSKYFVKVVSIEPSVKGQSIARQLHPAMEFPNIEWKNGFAEEILPKIEFKEPSLFVTGCVLSHLRDREVIKICQIINENAKIGSILNFVEAWGKDWHQLRWHVRTKEWWQNQLSNWRIDFHGPAESGHSDWHMGFHAVKIK